MKILVLQLARLGDIFQTWPTFHALHRQGAEVHVLVRPRFRAAAEGCEGIQKIHEFATNVILAPLLSDARSGLQPSVEALDALMYKLDNEKYDRIINLSFSPLSSWITFELEMRAFQREKPMATSGYTRHIDGALAIPDDASAFFFAQVGYRAQTGSTEPINRLSIPRLFATIAGVDPIESDWHGPVNSQAVRAELNVPQEFIAVHIGASDEAKTLDAHHWGEVVQRIVRRTGKPVILLGAAGEVEKSKRILAAVELNTRVFSLVGKTDVAELSEILKKSLLLVAGDSALVQIASLVGTKVLNLSSRTVSHWETGPASAGSRILLYGGARPAAEIIVREVESMLGESVHPSVADRFVSGPIEEVAQNTGDEHADFMWRLISAIYMGTTIPKNVEMRLQNILEQWSEVQSIENHQLNSLQQKTGDARQIAMILDRVVEITRLLVEAEPRLGPIERWWSTERIRLGPQPHANLIGKYQELNGRLETVLSSLREIEVRNDGQQLDI